MKRFIAALLLILFTAVCAPAMTACGGGDDSAAGSYMGISYKFVSDDDSQRVENDPFRLTLTSGGKGSFMHDGETADVTWKLSGERLSLTETYMGVSIDYTGMLKDGRLILYNGDPQSPFTCEYLFQRQ